VRVMPYAKLVEEKCFHAVCESVKTKGPIRGRASQVKRVLKKILLGFGVLSNIATLIGLWIAYISVPASVQAKIGHVFLIAGASCSVALYLWLAWVIFQPSNPSVARPSYPNTGAGTPGLPEPQDEECKALRAIADEDAEKIRDRVRQIGQRVEFHFTPGSDHYIEIFTELLNASVFDVVTVGKVEGQTMYGGQQLSSPPQVFDKTGPPGPTLLNLKHGEWGTVRIRQFISTDVADRMWADRSRNIAVDMSLVRITFKMLLANRPLREFMFYGPRTTIEEAKRV
jgi:hypothetical protein